MTLARYQHAGAAPVTALNGNINPSVTSFATLVGTGYPDGSVGLFVICVDPGTASQEKILCASRSGTSFTVPSGGRGYDGTVATSHSSGAVVTHVFAAAEADDDNSHIYVTSRNDHTQYALLAGATFTGVLDAGDGLVVAAGATVAGGATVTGGVATDTLLASSTVQATTGPAFDRHSLSTGANLGTSSTSPAEISSSLRCTVVVPASGMVRVTQAAVLAASSVVDGILYVSANGGSSWVTTGAYPFPTSTLTYTTVPASVLLSGLTPGSTVFQMGWAASTAAANAVQIFASLRNAAATGTWMLVEAIDT